MANVTSGGHVENFTACEVCFDTESGLDFACGSKRIDPTRRSCCRNARTFGTRDGAMARTITAFVEYAKSIRCGWSVPETSWAITGPISRPRRSLPSLYVTYGDPMRGGHARAQRAAAWQMIRKAPSPQLGQGCAW